MRKVVAAAIGSPLLRPECAPRRTFHRAGRHRRPSGTPAVEGRAAARFAPKETEHWGKETSQRIGIEGAHEIKEWLEATTRFAFIFTA